jgi:hypothetical protein
MTILVNNLKYEIVNEFLDNVFLSGSSTWFNIKNSFNV